MAARKKKTPTNEWEEMQKVIDAQGEAIARIEKTVRTLVLAMCTEARRRAAINLMESQKKKGG